MNKTKQKAITIQQMIELRLKQYKASIINDRHLTKHMVYWNNNWNNSMAYKNLSNNLAEIATDDTDVMLIDITDWSPFVNSIIKKRITQLTDFCKKHNNAELVIIVYKDNNPLKQATNIIYETMPRLSLHHFFSCNNTSGNYRAICYKKLNKGE